MRRCPMVYATVETLTGLFGGILSLSPAGEIENRGCASTRPGNALPWIVDRVSSVNRSSIDALFDRPSLLFSLVTIFRAARGIIAATIATADFYTPTV